MKQTYSAWLPGRLARLLVVLGLLLAMGSAAQAQVFSGALTTASPLFNRPAGSATPPTNLTNAGTAFYYQVIPVAVSTAGTYTFRGSSNFDSFGILYSSAGFSPSTPLTNAIQSNDDVINSVGFDFAIPQTLSAGTYYLVFTSFGVRNTGTFTLTVSGPAAVTYAVPTLTSIIPSAAPVGQPVTLTGTNLSGATAVTFNTTTQTTITNNTSTSLTVIVPTGATDGLVTVTTPVGTSNGVQFGIVVVREPLVFTDVVTALTASSATFGGAISDDNGGNVTSQGFVYSVSSTNGTPIIGGTGVTQVAGTLTLSNNFFSQTVTGLVPNTTYTVRAYATNSAGTGYGDPRSFTTLAPAPTLAAISPNSARVGTPVTLTGSNLTGATAVTFAGTSNNTVTTGLTVGGTGSGQTLTILVPSGATSGNVTVTTPGGTSNGVAFTVVPPATTVTAITRVGSSPTNAGSVSFTVTFAAAVTGVSVSNFALATTGLTGAGITVVSGAGTTYTVTASTGTSDGTLGLNLTNATGLSPGVSNVPFIGQVYTIDKTAPTVTITSPTAPNGGYSTTSPFTYTLTFSEDVSAPIIRGSNISGGTLTRTSASTFAASLTPGNPGAVTLTLPANVATDAAGNGNPTASYTILYNVPTAAPVLTSPANNSALATSQPTFAGTAPAGSTVTLYLASGSSAAQAIGTTTANPSNGSFSLTPPTALLDGPYAVYATAQLSGQTVSANSNTNTFAVDTTPPTATLRTTAGSSTSTSPIPFSVTFSEPVTGLSASSFTVSNGTVTSGSLAGSGSGPYTFSVTPTGNGPVSVSVPAGAVRDAVGNGNTASNIVSVQYAAPVVSCLRVLYQTGDLGQPTDGQVRPFFQVVNSGPTAVPYAQLTFRYWLTVENFQGQLVTPIDYAKLGTSFVSARYVQLASPRQGAYGYIEYAFAAGAGSLAPGTSSGDIYGKAYKPDFSSLDETDDWSYQTSSAYTTNDHVTLYQNGTLLAGTEPAQVTAATALQVLTASRDASASPQFISLQLQVRNTGNVPVNYADVRARYYFTRDGATTVVPELDYAKLGNGNVSLRVVNLPAALNGADAYVEVSFSSALGTFYPRSSTDDILFKLRKDNYQAFDQTNDYSFNSSTALVLNPRVTALVSNRLVFGSAPTGAPARMAGSSQPATAAMGGASIMAAASGPLALTAGPNPFGEQLTLRFALPTAQAYTLAVYDGQGRLVQQLASGQAEAEQAQEVAVPTQGYATGLYLVRLTAAQGVQTLKLIKR